VSAVEVCKLADVPVAGALAVVVGSTPVAIVRDSDGGVHALRDICSHADVALSEGEVDGCTLECWLHGSRFDLRTGEPSGPPAVTPVPVYLVRVEGEGDDAVVLVDVTVNAAAR
jgi:3-phenylpropionate/trans-cinnamate dioxygenase ferredoxin subunit